MRWHAVALLLVLAFIGSGDSTAPTAAADLTADDSAGQAAQPCQHGACGAADDEQQFIPHEYEQADPWHWQLMQHVGLLLLQHNTSSNGSSTPPSAGGTEELIRHAGRLLLDAPSNSSSTAIPPEDTTAAAAVTEPSTESDSPAESVAASTALTVSSSNPAIAALERKEVLINDMFRAALVRMGMADPSRAWVRYYRVKVARIMLLLTDIAWLMYAVGGCAQRAFALLVPVVKVGRTGELKLTAVSVLEWAVLISDFVARFGDMLAKFFLVVFRGINLAATLPPAS